MNVFHWHITDSQSFPLYLESIPAMAEFGAYSPEQTYNKVNVVDSPDKNNHRLQKYSQNYSLHPNTKLFILIKPSNSITSTQVPWTPQPPGFQENLKS